jgi:hypothetical protein
MFLFDGYLIKREFDIYIHGNLNLLEQGSDEKGKYHKIYYQEKD